MPHESYPANRLRFNNVERSAPEFNMPFNDVGKHFKEFLTMILIVDVAHQSEIKIR